MKSTADFPPSLPLTCSASFPSYGVAVSATTIDGKTGIWIHGDCGWYPEGKWGRNEFPHDHIVSWIPLANAERTEYLSSLEFIQPS